MLATELRFDAWRFDDPDGHGLSRQADHRRCSPSFFIRIETLPMLRLAFTSRYLIEAGQYDLAPVIRLVSDCCLDRDGESDKWSWGESQHACRGLGDARMDHQFRARQDNPPGLAFSFWHEVLDLFSPLGPLELHLEALRINEDLAALFSLDPNWRGRRLREDLHDGLVSHTMQLRECSSVAWRPGLLAFLTKPV